MLALLFVSGVWCANYATLESDWSADKSQVATRALLVRTQIGVPYTERSLLVDTASGKIELDGCLRLHSYTNRNSSDVLIFGEELMIDAEERAGFRVDVRDHCDELGAMSPWFYKACAGATHCHGVLGLDRTSALWDVWTQFSISPSGLLFGRNHPETVRRKQLRPLECSGDSLCELEKMVVFGDGDRIHEELVSVGFHMHDSYTYASEELVAILAEAGRVRFAQHDTGAEFTITRQTLAHSRGGWLEHTATGEEESQTSALYFQRSGVSSETSLLRAWKHGNRISIGNAVLAERTLHFDVARRTLRVEERLRDEHFRLVDVILAIALVFLWVRSVTLSLNELGWLATGLGVQCGCGKRHSVSDGALYHWSVVCGTVFLVLVSLAVSLDRIALSGASVAIGAVFVLNCAFVAVLLAPRVILFDRLHRFGRQAHGRQYRDVFELAIAQETLLMIAIGAVTLRTRQDSDATILTAASIFVACVNGLRYLWYTMIRKAPALCVGMINGLLFPIAALVYLHDSWVHSTTTCAALAAGALLLAQWICARHESVRQIHHADKIAADSKTGNAALASSQTV